MHPPRPGTVSKPASFVIFNSLLGGVKCCIFAAFLAAVVLLAGFAGLLPAPVQAQDTISVTYTVRAYVDGRSQLILQGNTAQWYHLDFAAPGRHEFVNEPTYINGAAWYPTWPDVPDAENRDCHCYSSVYTGLNPPLPAVYTEGNIDASRIRGTLTVLESPHAANGYRLVIELDDNAWGGPAWYEITIEQHWFTPRGQFERLKTVTVPGWLNEGVINKGQANALTVKLDGVLAQLDAGKPLPACNVANAFGNEVNALVKAGKLSAAQAADTLGAVAWAGGELCGK